MSETEDEGLTDVDRFRMASPKQARLLMKETEDLARSETVAEIVAWIPEKFDFGGSEEQIIADAIHREFGGRHE